VTIPSATTTLDTKYELIADLLQDFLDLHKDLKEFDGGRGLLWLTPISVPAPKPELEEAGVKRLLHAAVPPMHVPSTMRVTACKLFDVPFLGRPSALYLDMATAAMYVSRESKQLHPILLERNELEKLSIEALRDLKAAVEHGSLDMFKLLIMHDLVRPS
jgi:hypothetical protein